MLYALVERVPLGRPESSYWAVKGPGCYLRTWNRREDAETQLVLLQVGFGEAESLVLLANPAGVEVGLCRCGGRLPCNLHPATGIWGAP